MKSIIFSIEVVTCVIFIFGNFTPVISLNDSKDLLLTLQEKSALNEFKTLVWGELKEEFMKSDFYLIRWIRKTNLNVQSAKNLLMETIQWRESNNIANIVNEDWSDLELDYPMSLEGHDKKGRPLLIIDLGDWDLRNAVTSGKIKRLQRYLTYSSERATRNIYKAQKEGRKVTRQITLVDADGVNIRQQGCALCLSFLVQWTFDHETHYPSFTEENIIINAPSVGAFIWNAVRAIAPQALRDRMISFDGNRKVWMEYLDERIDKNQRPTRYGGTKS